MKRMHGIVQHDGVDWKWTGSEWPRPQEEPPQQIDLVPTMHLLVEANQYLATGIIPWRYHALGDPEVKQCLAPAAF